MTKIHEMITFKVPLTAVIKDYRLGLLNYFFFTCIFIYILGYELWWKVGYMFKPELGLAMRVTLREPDEFHYPAYCGKNLSSTCSKHSKGSWKGCNFQGIKRPCRQLHGQAASYQDADRFTVITRKTVVSRLPLESSKHVSQFYVQDIENFTMMLQPTVFTLTSTELHNGTVAGSELKGYLYVGNRGGASNHVQDQLCREKGKGPAFWCGFDHPWKSHLQGQDFATCNGLRWWTHGWGWCQLSEGQGYQGTHSSQWNDCRCHCGHR